MRNSRATVLAVALLVCASALPALAQQAEQRAIDPLRSSATFSIEHIFVDRVTGTVPIASGSLTFTPGSPVPSSISALLDPTRLRTDEPDRDSSLKSPDYFDVRLFPTWTFVSTKIAAAGPAAWTIDGMLTMHGVAQPEHLDVTVRGTAANPEFRAVGHIDRHAFGMKGARLDPVIGNDAEVTLDIVLKDER